MQAGYAFGLVYISLSVLALRFQQMTNLGAEVQRLITLAQAVGLFEGEFGNPRCVIRKS